MGKEMFDRGGPTIYAPIRPRRYYIHTSMSDGDVPVCVHQAGLVDRYLTYIICTFSVQTLLGLPARLVSRALSTQGTRPRGEHPNIQNRPCMFPPIP